jgi:hypothetical protein
MNWKRHGRGYSLGIFLEVKVKKGKAIPVIGRGGP